MQIPFSHDDMSRFFRMKEREYGLPEGYLMRTAQLESSLDPNAQNPNSSAGGLFQFIDSTAKDYGLNDKYNWIEATDAAARLARDNSQSLRLALGREPSGAELYLAHQQGGGGASSLLSNPNALASSVVGGDAVRLNAGNAGMTAGDFANQWLNKYDDEAYPMSNQLGPTRAAAAQTPQGRMSKFDTFREDMRIGSNLLGEGIMRELGEGPSETELLRRRLQNERQERIQNIEAGMNVINAEPDFFDVRAEAYPYRQPGPMHPTEVPPDYYDPRGPHQIPDPSSAPLTSPRPQTRVSTSGGETTTAAPAAAPTSPNEVEEEARTGFFGKIADVLYPNAEDNDEAKGKLREFLGALGVGLGQMSQGEAVNLNPYFARIAGEKQAAIDSYQNAIEHRDQTALAQQQLQVSRGNLAVAQGKLATDIAEAKAKGQEYMATPAMLEEWATLPGSKPFIDMMRSNDTNIRKQGLDGIANLAKEAAESVVDTNPALGELATLIENDAPIELIAPKMVEAGVDPKGFRDLMTALGKTPHQVTRLAEDLMNADPALQQVMGDVIQKTAGISETPREASARQFVERRQEQLATVAAENYKTLAMLDELERLTKHLMQGDKADLGEAGIMARSIASMATAIGWQDIAEQMLNMDLAAEERVANLDATLSLIIAKPLMKGGGAISDGEREIMQKTVSGTKTTHEARLNVIDRLRMTYHADRIALDTFNNLANDIMDENNSYVGIRGAWGGEAAGLAAPLSEMVRAAQGNTVARYRNMSDVFARQYNSMGSRRERMEAVAPRLTQEQYEVWKDYLPSNPLNGKRAWQLVDNNGRLISYMMDVPTDDGFTSNRITFD